MTVLDAYAIVALLVDEPARGEVEALLRAPDAVPRLNAINLGEVIDKMVRVRRHLFDDVLERLIWLVADGLEVVDIDLEIGALAGLLRASHYRRRDKALSTADCHALATALVLEDSLATSDPALAAMALDEGVIVLPLPDSSGVRPG